MKIADDISGEHIGKKCVLFGLPSDSSEMEEEVLSRGVKLEGVVSGESHISPESLSGRLVLIADAERYEMLANELKVLGLLPIRDFRPLFKRLNWDEHLSPLFLDWSSLDESRLPSALRQKRDKYLDRSHRLSGIWSWLNTYLPQILYGPPIRFLDVGAGNGAAISIMEYFGHEAVGVDYTPDSEAGEWSFKPFIESEGLTVVNHDGRKIPYPFEANSFDVVWCVRAINALAAPREWWRVLDEFGRVASRYVFVNPNDGSACQDPWAPEGKRCLEEWSFEKFSLLVSDEKERVYLYG